MTIGKVCSWIKVQTAEKRTLALDKDERVTISLTHRTGQIELVHYWGPRFEILQNFSTAVIRVYNKRKRRKTSPLSFFLSFLLFHFESKVQAGINAITKWMSKNFPGGKKLWTCLITRALISLRLIVLWTDSQQPVPGGGVRGWEGEGQTCSFFLFLVGHLNRNNLTSKDDFYLSWESH